ncbi:membrane or secreted protein [Nonlabens ponticola]|uniref:Membrane or secreted protein n=1 Tax=Nonlabens ponticola TaxID=2496866 RepID=A0A3S9MVQ3_9FLAO|nr:membrane or secreted protein [Nonlabens ponticola]AZQ43306.1 membrane or secreted protein [Nonlabens ponticola]
MSASNDPNSIKKVNPIAKYFVLIVLFALPLVAYLFFLQGKHHFDTLPVVNDQVAELNDFKTIEGNAVQLADSVTIITFLGNKPYERLGYVSNLNEKIYKEFHEFDTFQMISIVPQSGLEDIAEIKYQMATNTDVEDWHFITATDEQINNFVNSLEVQKELNTDLSSDFAYVIDKNAAQRGRPKDDEEDAVYGYDTSSINDLQKVMIDDVRVLLAEYRFAFKENRDNKLKDDE